MTLTLVATVGGSNSNSYVSQDDADSYFEGRAFAAAWTGATSTEKDQALVHATALLERARWKGVRGITTSGALTQALAWPRRWAPTLEADAEPDVVAEDFIDQATAYYTGDTIPQPIVRATCELALELLRAGTTDPLTRDTTRNVRRKKTDVLETEYFDPGQRVTGFGLFPSVVALIAPLLRGGATEVERA